MTEPQAETAPKPQGRHPVLGGIDVFVGLLVLGGIWIALPARWWPVDVFGSALAVALLTSGVALFLGVPWARHVGIIIGVVALSAGAVLVTALAFTASYLSGLYGPVGGGGALLLAAVAVMIVPYLVVFPAAQLFVLLRVKS